MGPQGGKREPQAVLPSPGQWRSEKSDGKGHGGPRVKGTGARSGGQWRRWGPQSACPSERGQAPASPGHEPPAPSPPGPLVRGGPQRDCRLGSLWPAAKSPQHGRANAGWAPPDTWSPTRHSLLEGQAGSLICGTPWEMKIAASVQTWLRIPRRQESETKRVSGLGPPARAPLSVCLSPARRSLRPRVELCSPRFTG